MPAANASWSDEAILLWDTVDIAVAVALVDGLITPIVKAADRKGLAAIANETKDLVERARAGKLKLEEFQGGTFSISNLGMYGVRDLRSQPAVRRHPGRRRRRAARWSGRRAGRRYSHELRSCDHRERRWRRRAQFWRPQRRVEDPMTML